VDNPPLCDFIFPAMIRRGPLQIAISTTGVSPVLARLLKQDLEQMLPDGAEKLLAFIEGHTPLVRERLPDVQRRRLFWERVVRGPVARLLLEQGRDAADAWLQTALVAAEKQEKRRYFSIVRIPSFDPDDLTVRAVKTMGRADVVVYEGGRATLPILDRYARRDGEKYPVSPKDAPCDVISQLGASTGIVVYLMHASAPDCDVRCKQLYHYAGKQGFDRD
jgi:uroporphyrin-III C-methyltransferase / precorrin-2 dehydrogenase / sirohydrochlorin ferrochelatase